MDVRHQPILTQTPLDPPFSQGEVASALEVRHHPHHGMVQESTCWREWPHTAAWTLHEAEPPLRLRARPGGARRWLLVGLVLCRGLVLLCVMPPFEGWDEYQHVGYVEHVRQTGQAAVIGETMVPPAVLEAAVQFPQPRHAVDDQLKPHGAVGYSTYWADPSLGASRRNEPALPGSTFPVLLPARGPVFGALGGVSNLEPRWRASGFRTCCSPRRGPSGSFWGCSIESFTAKPTPRSSGWLWPRTRSS